MFHAVLYIALKTHVPLPSISETYVMQGYIWNKMT